MREMVCQISMTIFGTVLAGVILYIISEYFKLYVLNPLQRYKELKGKTIAALTYYAREFSSPGYYAELSEDGKKRFDKASEETRLLASDYRALLETKIKHHLGIPKNVDIIEIRKRLIGLSNGVYIYSKDDSDTKKDNSKYIENIKEILKVKDE